MSRTTHESLLISALINLQDAHAGKLYGVEPNHLLGFRDEYEWVLAHYAQYARTPTQTEFSTVFPFFPFSEDQTDARWPGHEVKRAFASRQLLRACSKATGALTRNQVEEAYAAIDGMILETTSEIPRNLLVDHSYLDDYEHTDEVRVTLPWNTLQGMTGGMGPGELWYLAARQGQGKSNAMLEIATQAVLDGHSVMIYSLEMTKRQIQVRMHANLGHRLGFAVDSKAMLHRQFDHLAYKRIVQAIEEKVPGHMHIHEASMGRVTPALIASRAAEYDLVLVDYGGLMFTDDGRSAISDYRAMAEISNNLKEVALGKMGRVIAAAQINREGETYGLRPPKMKTIAQSDHLGNDGDVVLTLKQHGRGATIWSIEKNRHGDAGHLFFSLYDPNNGDYREITRDEADNIKDASEDD